MATVPLQTAPQEQLAAGSEVQIPAGPNVQPQEDVVSGDIAKLGKAQQVFGQAINKLDDELNDAEGKRLANDYYAEVEATKNEYTSLKGANAVKTVEVDGERITVFEQYQNKLKSIYESYENKASNGTVRYIFGNKASVYTNSGLNDMTKHSLKEQRSYNINETTKEITINETNAKTHHADWNNPDGEFRKFYTIGLLKIDELAKLKGWNTDPNAEDASGNKIGISSQYLAEVERYNMGIMKAVIKSLEDKNDFVGAGNFLKSLDPNGESKDIQAVAKKVTAKHIEHNNSKCVNSIISHNGNQNDGTFPSQSQAVLCLSSNQAHDNNNGGSVVDGENSNEVDTTDKTQSENLNSLDQRRSTSKFFSSDSKLNGTLIPEHQTTHLYAIQRVGVEKADSLYTKAKSSIEYDKGRYKVDPEYATEINKQIISKYNELILEEAGRIYGNKEIPKLIEKIEALRKRQGGGRSFQGSKKTRLAELEAALDKARANDPKYVDKIENDLGIITDGIDYDYSGESIIEVDEVTGLQPLAVLKANLKKTITDPKELATATKDLEIKYNKIKTEREENYREAFEQAQEIAFADGNGWKDLAANGIDIDDFTEADQKILRNGPPEESNIEVLAELDANPAEVRDNLNAYRPKLSATQYLRLKEYAASLNSESKYVEATGDNTLFKDTLYKNGYTWVHDTLKGENAAKFHSIKTAWINRIDYVQTHVENRKLTREEKLRLLNNVLLDEVNVGGFLGKRDISIGEIVDPSKLSKTWVHVNVEQENGKFKKEKIY